MLSEHDTFASHLVACGLSVSERIVAQLIEPLLDQEYRVIADNFFTSVRLADYWFSRSTLLLGTLRVNRGVPIELRVANLEAPNSLFMRRNGMMIVRFSVKKASGVKDVYLLDTCNAARVEVIERVRRGGRLKRFPKPESVIEYNKAMGANDNVDAIIESCTAAREFPTVCETGNPSNPKSFTEHLFHLPGFVQAAAKEFYRLPEDDNKDTC